jgi:hypothetical protein
MCHGNHFDWHTAEEEDENLVETPDEPLEGDEPSFLEDEEAEAEDVELLTDGGDDADE